MDPRVALGFACACPRMTKRGGSRATRGARGGLRLQQGGPAVLLAYPSPGMSSRTAKGSSGIPPSGRSSLQSTNYCRLISLWLMISLWLTASHPARGEEDVPRVTGGPTRPAARATISRRGEGTTPPRRSASRPAGAPEGRAGTARCSCAARRRCLPACPGPPVRRRRRRPPGRGPKPSRRF